MPLILVAFVLHLYFINTKVPADKL
jgi:hypothetical protein